MKYRLFTKSLSYLSKMIFLFGDKFFSPPPSSVAQRSCSEQFNFYSVENNLKLNNIYINIVR